MIPITYYEYSCQCGSYLFNDADIETSTSLWGINYIFVKKPTEVPIDRMRIRLQTSNIAKCINCNKTLGTITFPYNPHQEKVRFSLHLIQRRTVNIYMIKTKDENNKTHENVHFYMQRGNAISIPRSR